MIYTITFNASLDYIVDVENFQINMTNRTSYESMVAGGKGINVSQVLANFDIQNTALGYVAGFSGQEICRLLDKQGINTNFIELEDGHSRINVKLRNIEGTEINGLGPVICKDKLKQLFIFLDTLNENDYLVLAGSIPASMPDTIYHMIMERVASKNIYVIVDCTSTLLLNVLELRPFLIKPNHHELGELFNVVISSKEDAIFYAKKLQQRGARNVIVSMSKLGAIFVGEDGTTLELDVPKGKVVNTVGAGDSMVAGFLIGWLERNSYQHAFKMAVCVGSASAYLEGFATKGLVEQLYNSY